MAVDEVSGVVVYKVEFQVQTQISTSNIKHEFIEQRKI
ncbi:hypothetical protein SAMN05421636_103152 [Pricia antarctica]|uniref:Uncharacterized protein n=1 Tax=Pricia antarctica TaxID=641691 RepID=A0A1G6ZXU7_9FLAO|nr:hypothetical protein SAMN05421636_103152 [Pricia antarctica]